MVGSRTHGCTSLEIYNNVMLNSFCQSLPKKTGMPCCSSGQPGFNALF
jgi:hypothetical protein